MSKCQQYHWPFTGPILDVSVDNALEYWCKRLVSIPNVIYGTGALVVTKSASYIVFESTSIYDDGGNGKDNICKDRSSLKWMKMSWVKCVVVSSLVELEALLEDVGLQLNVVLMTLCGNGASEQT